MARFIQAAVLAAALILPASAGAAGGRPPNPGRGGDPVALAKTIALRFWGAVPCGGPITVLTERPVPRGLDPTTDGWVTFSSSLGENDLEAPASTYTRCTISLARWQWPTRTAMERDWNMFCLTVIHEVGHLLGHRHSTIPGSVMAPVFTGESNVPRLCRTSRPLRAPLLAVAPRR